MRYRLRLCLIVVVIFCSLFPPLWMFLTSLKRGMDTMAYPPKLLFTPTLDNYRQLLSFTGEWEGYYMLTRYLPNSLITSLASTTVTLVVSILAAFSMARFVFPGRKLILFAIICTRMFAPIAMIMPLYTLVQALGLADTTLALLVTYTGINIPFAVWMLKGFIDEIPETLEEAAMVDGCTKFSALARVTLPLITPGVAAAGIFTFILCWNDFQIAFFLTSKDAKTLPLQALSFLTETGLYWGPMSAYGTLVMLPAIAFAYYCQKYITRGLTQGSVKE